MDDVTARPDPPVTPRAAWPARRQWLLLAVIGVAALALFFLAPVVGRLFAPKPPPAAAAPPPGTFQATAEQWATLGLTEVKSVDFAPGADTEGNIAVNDTRTTAVFSPYTGRVTRVFAKMGDHVRAGAPLFAIDAGEIIQAQSDLLTAAAQARQTRAALARQQSLLKTNGAALKDVEQAQTDATTAQAALESARNRLRVLGFSASQITAAETGAAAHGITADAVVTAPISGVVTQRNVGVGQNLASLANNGGGGAPLFAISDLSTVWLVGALREDDAPAAKVGQAVEVRVPALPGKVFHARINFVSPMVDPSTRRVTVRAEVPNPGGELLPQMFADFDLVTGPAHAALAVPADGVIYEGEGARVWVARPGHLLELRQIKTGQTHDGVVEVTEGLKAGDQVVTSGALFIDRASKGT
jgi:cobalt-zinc-cadmium efflux system membrane fusion protein